MEHPITDERDAQFSESMPHSDSLNFELENSVQQLRELASSAHERRFLLLNDYDSDCQKLEDGLAYKNNQETAEFLEATSVMIQDSGIEDSEALDDLSSFAIRLSDEAEHHHTLSELSLEYRRRKALQRLRQEDDQIEQSIPDSLDLFREQQQRYSRYGVDALLGQAAGLTAMFRLELSRQHESFYLKCAQELDELIDFLEVDDVESHATYEMRIQYLAERIADYQAQLQITTNETFEDTEVTGGDEQVKTKEVRASDARIAVLNTKFGQTDTIYPQAIVLANIDHHRSQGMSDRRIYTLIAKNYHPDVSNHEHSPQIIRIITGLYDGKQKKLQI